MYLKILGYRLGVCLRLECSRMMTPDFLMRLNMQGMIILVLLLGTALFGWNLIREHYSRRHEFMCYKGKIYGKKQIVAEAIWI